jgi:Glycosyl transferase family 2
MIRRHRQNECIRRYAAYRRCVRIRHSLPSSKSHSGEAPGQLPNSNQPINRSLEARRRDAICAGSLISSLLGLLWITRKFAIRLVGIHQISKDGYLSKVPIDFSVVIPTFRRPNELIEAINSVLRQQGVTIEVFVIDDSPEGSAEQVIGNVGDSRVIYLKNPNPTGGVPSIVRNIGWLWRRGRSYISSMMTTWLQKDITQRSKLPLSRIQPSGLFSGESNRSVTGRPRNWSTSASTSPTRRRRLS